jgi:hypothetical protein
VLSRRFLSSLPFCYPSGNSSYVFDHIFVLPWTSVLAWVRLAGPRAASIVARALLITPVNPALHLPAGSSNVATKPAGRLRLAK